MKRIVKILIILNFLMALNTKAMINHLTKVEIIGKKPSQIYDFMFGLNKEIYIAWHPAEHKDFGIVKETDHILGSVFFFHEKMENLTVKYNWEVVELVQNHKIVMKAQYFIPVYLMLTFDETANGTVATHDLQIGYKKKITGLVDWAVQQFVFSDSKQNTLTKHVNEEFKNLETLLQ